MRPGPNRFRELAPVAAGLIMAALVDSGCAFAAGPTVGALVAVCDRAFAQGFSGVDAAACEWFAAPCACKLRDSESAVLPWCVPDTEPIETTVGKVVALLRVMPDRDAPAEPVVRAVLMRLYPCGQTATPGR
jgi:Rap1a immunity proteins